MSLVHRTLTDPGGAAQAGAGGSSVTRLFWGQPHRTHTEEHRLPGSSVLTTTVLSGAPQPQPGNAGTKPKGCGNLGITRADPAVESMLSVNIPGCTAGAVASYQQK